VLELVALILRVFRASAVYQPLFAAFGPQAIERRLGTSQAKVVVTDAANRSKLDALANPPIIVGIDAGNDDIDFLGGLGCDVRAGDADRRQHTVDDVAVGNDRATE
jgi:acyl-coenzyme A synthetase/AMP-(fatty) acid ligase